jgi:hypothetical protein
MVPHLSKCVLVGLDVRNQALEEINGKKIHFENPPILGCLASMPLPAIMTASGYTTYPNPGLGVSAMPSESPSPSPLFLLATLLNID